jgi:hypothetical protein
MLNRKPRSFEEMAQGWGRLSEALTTPAPVNPDKGALGLLIESRQGVDGQFYGILKENDGYYVKIASADADGQAPGPDAYQYIGGYANRLREGFASLPKAKHRVHLKLHALNESLQPAAPIFEGPSAEELLRQLDAAPAPEAAAPEPAPAPEGAIPPAPGLEAALGVDPAADPAAAPAGELPADPSLDPAAAPAPAGDGDEDGEITPDKILSMVGKLGAALDKLGAAQTPQLAQARRYAPGPRLERE